MSTEERKTASQKSARRHDALEAEEELLPRKAPKHTSKKKPTARKKKKEKTIARRVGQATMKGIRRFNTFTSSQGNIGKKRTFHITLTFRMFIVVSLVIVFLMLLALDNQSISVDEQSVAIAGLPNALENYRILHISDLHASEFGADQSSLLRTVNGLSYDIMIITGDMVGASGNAEPFLDFLRGLKRTSNVYFIAGDSDPGPLLDRIRNQQGTLEELVLADWILEAKALGAHYVDSPISVAVGNSGTTLWISPFAQLGISSKKTVALLEEQVETERIGFQSGIDADYISYPFTDYRYRIAQKLLTAAGQMDADDVHIALAHVPPSDTMISIAQDDHSNTSNDYLYPPDLILSGHYCSGVWRLPGYGALYIPDATQGKNGWFPSQARVRGQISVGSSVLHVSAGLGATDDVKLPFRLFNTPQVTRITLTGLLTDHFLGN